MAFRAAPTGTVRVQPLAERRSKHELSEVLIDPAAPPPPAGALDEPLARLADAIRDARQADASVILCYGAHLVKNGLGPVVGRLLEAGWVTHLATNGAGVIHDWEYAFGGRSEEDVRQNLTTGTFGAWDETGRYTLMALAAGALEERGYGESLGRLIHDGGIQLPRRSDLSSIVQAWALAPDDAERAIAAADLLRCMSAGDWAEGWHAVEHLAPDTSLTVAALRARVPLTVHPGIGYDIVYVHPQASPAVFGRAAGIDFRVLCESVDRLGSDGVVFSVGSAVMAPQVLEKAASVANNLRLQRGDRVIGPTIAVNDLQPSSWDWAAGEPPADDPAYYLRFLKSFSRISPGRLTYLPGDNRMVLQQLLHRLSG